MTIDPTLDVVALELGDDRVELVEGEGFVNTSLDLGWPDIREISSTLPQVDGTVDHTSRFGARAITVGVGVVDALDANGVRTATWKQALSGLARFLHPESRPTLHVRLDGVDYWITVVPATAAAPFEFPHHARAQIALRAPDPYLRTTTKSVAAAGYQAGTAGRTYPWTTPRTYPVSNGVSGSFVAGNDGNAPVWPVVTLWGPMVAAGFTLENSTTGQEFKMLPVTVEEAHRLVIDMRNRTVRYDGDPELPRFSLVDFTNSDWLVLHPGDNELQFITDAGGLAAMISVEWSDPYLWPGGLEP